MSAELRSLRDAAAREYDDEKNGAARCTECSISTYQEPLYHVEFLGVPELRCSCCAWGCSDCGRAVATVHVLGRSHDWESCPECALREYGVHCCEVFEIPLGSYPALPPVLFPRSGGPFENNAPMLGTVD